MPSLHYLSVNLLGIKFLRISFKENEIKNGDERPLISSIINHCDETKILNATVYISEQFSSETTALSLETI